MPTKITITLAAAALVFVGAYGTRIAVARVYPGLPAYYSFDGEIFTFDHTFKSGKVGPFSVGTNKKDLIASIDKYGSSFILTMEMNKSDEAELYYNRQIKVSPSGKRVLLSSNLWKVAFREQGAVTVYHISFENDRALKIRLVSTLGA